ncbi:MAG: carbohydrate porin [Filimonas sp.]|nr:carbohydrate porin [Filimonas sp.]
MFYQYHLCSIQTIQTYLRCLQPEAAAGKGLSQTLGVAGFPNGEIYRVGDPAPKLFVARLYAEQRIPLSPKKDFTDDDLNQVKEYNNTEYISIIGGKFALTDFFDGNNTSQDPRTQFYNWSLMASGAWDYPANTRGYNFGAVIQAYIHDWAFRYAITSMPKEANEANMEFRLNKAEGMVLEIEKQHLLQKDDTHYSSAHIGVFYNQARMGNYAQSIHTGLVNAAPPDITDSREYGNVKKGIYGCWETNSGPFHYLVRGSWNDGKAESWAFTEIDNSYAFATRIEGSLWKRKNDNIGIAVVSNGLSNDHRTYLANGGYGFIIGDGKLNYSRENIIEAYYFLNIWRKLSLTPDYQFILHPGYNKDRGPAHVVALRLHVEI